METLRLRWLDLLGVLIWSRLGGKVGVIFTLRQRREDGAMRRILIPLIFVAMLTVAAVIPVAADTGSKSGYPEGGCDFSSSL